ncbi:22229_t:CDS:1, partial [Entrophospora sp. SA101]
LKNKPNIVINLVLYTTIESELYEAGSEKILAKKTRAQEWDDIDLT